MPKITDTPKTRTQIQSDSDVKRGVKVKNFKLHESDIEMIVQSAEILDIPQNQLIVEAVKFYMQHHATKESI